MKPTMEPSTRPASPEDAAAIRAIARAAYQRYVAAIGREPAPMVADFEGQIGEGRIDLLVLGETVAGFAVHFPRAEDYFVENIAIDPACQGQGLGRWFMAWIDARARAAGRDRVRLYTNEKMTENLVFYPRLGFEEEERRFEDGFHRVYFVKPLAG